MDSVETRRCSALEAKKKENQGAVDRDAYCDVMCLRL